MTFTYHCSNACLFVFCPFVRVTRKLKGVVIATQEVLRSKNIEQKSQANAERRLQREKSKLLRRKREI